MEKALNNHAYKIVFVLFILMLIAWSVFAADIFIKEGKMNTTRAVIKERTVYYSYTYKYTTHTFYDCDLSYTVDDKKYTARVILKDVNTGDYVTLKTDPKNPAIFQLAVNQELIIIIEAILVFLVVVTGIVAIPHSNKKKEEGEVIN